MARERKDGEKKRKKSRWEHNSEHANGQGPSKKNKVKLGTETSQPVYPETSHPTTSKAATSQQPTSQTPLSEQPPSQISHVDQVFRDLFESEPSLLAPVPAMTLSQHRSRLQLQRLFPPGPGLHLRP